jgi:hypothetical protein
LLLYKPYSECRLKVYTGIFSFLRIFPHTLFTWVVGTGRRVSGNMNSGSVVCEVGVFCTTILIASRGQFCQLVDAVRVTSLTWLYYSSEVVDRALIDGGSASDCLMAPWYMMRMTALCNLSSLSCDSCARILLSDSMARGSFGLGI